MDGLTLVTSLLHLRQLPLLLLACLELFGRPSFFLHPQRSGGLGPGPAVPYVADGLGAYAVLPCNEGAALDRGITGLEAPLGEDLEGQLGRQCFLPRVALCRCMRDCLDQLFRFIAIRG
eukprot:762614-Hanusia_phi.AAC.4